MCIYYIDYMYCMGDIGDTEIDYIICTWMDNNYDTRGMVCGER